MGGKEYVIAVIALKEIKGNVSIAYGKKIFVVVDHFRNAPCAMPEREAVATCGPTD